MSVPISESRHPRGTVLRCKSSLARAIVFRGEAVEESPATSEFEVHIDFSLLLAYLTALHTQKNYPVSSAPCFGRLLQFRRSLCPGTSRW